MIGNQSSQVAQPKDDYIEYYVEQNQKEGGENNMSNDNLDKGVVPAVDVTATTEPDGKGTMATAKGEFPANAKEKATRRYAKKSLKKAIRSIEKARTSLSEISIDKAALPRTGRATGTPAVSNETGPSVAKAETPDTGRAASVTVANETNPYGDQLIAVRSALLSLRKAEKALVGVGRYAAIANSVVSQTAKPMTKDITDTVENIAGDVLKADVSCCDNACGACKGPGCGCCADCPVAVAKAETCDCGKEDCTKCASMTKAEDTDNDADSEPDDDEDDKPTDLKKSVWGGAFLPN